MPVSFLPLAARILAELQEIDLALRELELDFEDDHFFYQEIAMSAIAFVQRTT